MKKKLLALVLLASASMFAIEIGINIGAPPPPRIVHVRPVSPGPGYNYVEGYWYPRRRPLSLARRLLEPPAI